MWPVIIGAILGALKSQEEKETNLIYNRAEVEKTRNGNWTGQWGKNLPPTTGDLGNIAAGAAAGYGLQQKGDMTTPKGGGDFDTASNRMFGAQGFFGKGAPDTSRMMDDTRPESDPYMQMKRRIRNPNSEETPPTLYAH